MNIYELKELLLQYSDDAIIYGLILNNNCIDLTPLNKTAFSKIENDKVFIIHDSWYGESI